MILYSAVINGGAVVRFVAMARFSPRGNVRAMSVEALRVLSEDTHRSRRTRLLLCEDGAAVALGNIVKEDVEGDVAQESLIRALSREDEHERQSPQIHETQTKELHQALCAWANILDQDFQAPSAGTKEILEEACTEFVDVGGLESLLCITSLPFDPHPLTENRDKMNLIVEACRSLASLSPFLLSNRAASRGHTVRSVAVLQVLTRVFGNIIDSDDAEAAELKFEALRGIAVLAKYEPLKLIIVDKFLPSLFHANIVREEDPSHISGAASQICSSLGLSDGDFVKQIAGNDAKLMGDWFCMKRLLLIQLMARAEIHEFLSAVWKKPFHDLLQAGLLPSGMGNTWDQKQADSTGQHSTDSRVTENESGVEVQTPEDVFKTLDSKAESVNVRKTLLRQYHDVYGRDPSYSESTHGWQSQDLEVDSLLYSHVYPLSSTDTETDWLLSHRRCMRAAKANLSVDAQDITISNHVQNLMDSCIPSKLIQQDVLPIHDLQPESSFDFRSLLMPQRRYFSFRREGQLVSQLCDASFAGSDGAFWSIGFTNSSFAGEFFETLVQALYCCPLIRGLSFTRNEKWRSLQRLESEGDGQDTSDVLANLAGTLPPSVSSIIFDNTLDDTELTALAAVLDKMGRNLVSQAGGTKGNGKLCEQQGSLQSFAVLNSPYIHSESWKRFFNLLGHRSTASPLASLRVLDLSGNDLGDELSSFVLACALDAESGFCLEQLDLSRNAICKGTRVAKVLCSCAKLRRNNHSAKASSKVHLVSLNLGSNELYAGRLALEVIVLLKRNVFSVKSLDLSDNGLGHQGTQFTDLLLNSVLKNTCLCHLNLSGNEFDHRCIDSLLNGLNRCNLNSRLAFLRLEENRPPLSESQLKLLNNFRNVSRTNILQHYLGDKEQMKRRDAGKMDSLDDGAVATHWEGRASKQSVERKSDESVSLFSASDAQTASDASSRQSLTPSVYGGKGENMITVLFSAPLVYMDPQGKMCPFAKLNFDMERKLLWQCLKEASRDISLCFDNATHDRLLTAKSKRCTCLHYSGHGYMTHLPFEDEKGGTNWLDVGTLRCLIEQNEGAPFKFVFVSACHSGLVGETFAKAGVPHVVCCKQESDLKDLAALAFTRQFYLTLALGHTVKQSFEQGWRAVLSTPNLRNREEERNKFILLPKDDSHDVRIFGGARTVQEWPRVYRDTRNLDLSVHNMMQEDPSPMPPEAFIGREVDMYCILKTVLTNRLVSVLGDKGIGRSSVIYAVCHYINERRNTILLIDRIVFVKAAQNSTFVMVLRDLLTALSPYESAMPQSSDNMDWNGLCRVISNALNRVKALIVIDGSEVFESSTEKQDLVMFLSTLLQSPRTAGVRVLLSGRHQLGIESIGGVSEQPYLLGPLNFCNTVRLFGNMCPHLRTSADRQMFLERILTDGTQSNLLPTDRNATKQTKQLFHELGNGIPLRIGKAAYSISRNSLDRLGQDSTGT